MSVAVWLAHAVSDAIVSAATKTASSLRKDLLLSLKVFPV